MLLSLVADLATVCNIYTNISIIGCVANARLGYSGFRVVQRHGLSARSCCREWHYRQNQVCRNVRRTLYHVLMIFCSGRCRQVLRDRVTFYFKAQSMHTGAYWLIFPLIIASTEALGRAVLNRLDKTTDAKSKPPCVIRHTRFIQKSKRYANYEHFPILQHAKFLLC